MSRYTEPVCRLCRREGIKLFLKADRCLTDKCAIERRQSAPGQHGMANKKKTTQYGAELREKQKVKRIYGLTEEQNEIHFNEAKRRKGVTGTNLLKLLEQRLDNVVYRAGFSGSRRKARQFVRHGHVMVNGKTVSIPSYQTRVNDEVAVREVSRKLAHVVQDLEGVDRRGGVPDWMQLDRNAFAVKLTSAPERGHITLPIEEQLIVEFYS